MREVLRRNWRFWVVLTEVLVLTWVFAHYIERRTARVNASICAILDHIPVGIDSGIDKARRLDHCGRPHPPTAYFGRPFPTPHPTVTVTSLPAQPPERVVVVVPSPPHPAATTTPTRTPRPSPRPTHSPSPTPSPSRTPCLIPGVPPGCG